MRHRLMCLSLVLCAACPRPGATPVGRVRCQEEARACIQSLAQGQLDDAERACKLGQEFCPDDADLWTDLGLVRKAQGRVPEAKQCFIEALRRNQDSFQAYNDLGVLELEAGSYVAAERDFEHAVHILPDYTEARMNFGILYYREKKLDRARDAFLTIIQVNGRLTYPREWLAFIALETNDPAEAARQLQDAVQLEPSNFQAWRNLGVAWLELGRFNEAAEAFRACLREKPEESGCTAGVRAANAKAALAPDSVLAPPRQ